MTTDLFWIALAVGAFCAAMVLALVIPLRPDVLRITQRIVCPPGSSLLIRVVKLSYHRPGERGLTVVCRGPDGDRSVIGRAVFWLWVLLLVPSLALAMLAVTLISRSAG